MCIECEAGELLNVVGGRARILRAGAPLPARRVRLLQADAGQTPVQLHARLQNCRVSDNHFMNPTWKIKKKQRNVEFAL